MFSEPPHSKELARYFALAQVSVEMVAPIVLGLVVDNYLLWTAPWGVVGGAVFGLCGGLMHLVHLLNKMDSTNSSQPK